MDNNKKPRTDLRKLRTRKLIRDAFIELLQENELDKITVQRLADKATINRVTFYLHYRDIPDMVEKMADEMIRDLDQVMNRDNKQATGGQKWNSLVNLLEHIAEHADFYKIILGSNGMPIFKQRLDIFFRNNIISALERKGSDSWAERLGVKKEILIWYDCSALLGTIISWLQNDMPYTPVFLAKQFSLLHNRTGRDSI